MVYSTRRFIVCLTMCYFVLVFFSPFSIAITSLGEERANLSAFRTFDRFVFVWICRFPFPLYVWEGLRFVIMALTGLFFFTFFVIVALPGLFSYLFCIIDSSNDAVESSTPNPQAPKPRQTDRPGRTGCMPFCKYLSNNWCFRTCFHCTLKASN